MPTKKSRKLTPRNDFPLHDITESWPDFLSAADLADIFGTTRQNIYLQAKNGKFPAPSVRLGHNCTRWSKPTILAFLKGQTAQNQPEPAAEDA